MLFLPGYNLYIKIFHDGQRRMNERMEYALEKHIEDETSEQKDDHCFGINGDIFGS